MDKVTQKRISQAVSIGDYVYVLHKGKLGRTKVFSIEKDGIDTAFDYLPYDEHKERWWLTKYGAKTDIEQRANLTPCPDKKGR